MNLGTVTALDQAWRERRPVAFAKNLGDGSEFILPDKTAPEELNEAGAHALATGQSGTEIICGKPWFIEARNPPPRLILVGAVQIAQALVPMARITGYDCVVVDPRAAFCTLERFPDATLLLKWPEAAFQTLGLEARSAVVTLTHDPKFDEPALQAALDAPVFYIGALGSRRTHAARLNRLRERGIPEAALARIQAPVGLNIGAIGAGEIAVSILAAVIAARREAETCAS